MQKKVQQYITGSSTGKNIISTSFLEDHLNLNWTNKNPRSLVTLTIHFLSGRQGRNTDSDLLGEYYFQQFSLKDLTVFSSSHRPWYAFPSINPMQFVVLFASLQIKVFCFLHLRKVQFNENILELTQEMSKVILKDTLQHKQAY